MSLALAGRVAIVTGGTRGIGRAIATRLATDGADVAVTYVSHPPANVVQDIEAVGRRAVAIESDVSDAGSCESTVAAVHERLGGVDILVNNAAITDAHRPWDTISSPEWDAVMAVNAKGPFLAFKAAYPHLAASGRGRVVNISSVTVHLGQAGLAHYVSSKAALIGLTWALAREVGSAGITVNAITPGAIRTEAELEMFGSSSDTDAEITASQAVPRRGVAADVAAAVAFLVSDDASFISGHTLNVDGGWIMT